MVGQNTVTTVGIVILATATRVLTADRVFTEVEGAFTEMAALALAVIVRQNSRAFLASRLCFRPWACWQTSLVT